MRIEPGLTTKYQLTPEEKVVAESFHELQKVTFHNLRAEYAEMIVNQKVDPSNPQEYFVQKAYNQGMVNILTYLIDLPVQQQIQTSEV